VGGRRERGRDRRGNYAGADKVRDGEDFRIPAGIKFLVFVAADGVQRKMVTSSVIAAVGYAEPDGILEVEFSTGRVYWYFDVPRREYDALLGASSIGHYFNTRIRNRYRSSEVRAR